ncbi:MAG: OmpA family protein [Desulfocapsa sp.]|nr:OmpA family protein [Desulfocapsa sp.]
MSTKFNILYGSILAILVILMFWIFSIQKSTQLTLDLKDLQQTVEKKDQIIADIQQTLKETKDLTQNAKDKNKVIPKLTKNIAVLEEEIIAYRQQLEREKTAYEQHLKELQGELQIQHTQINERSKKLQSLKKEYVEKQHFLAQTEKAKLSSDEQIRELADALTASQELLEQKEEQLKQLTTALEEKSSAISFYNQKLQATEELLKLSESKNIQNNLNLSLILDELRSKNSSDADTGTQPALGQNGRSTTTDMNLSLILDELIQKTLLANALQDKLNVLGAKDTHSGISQQDIEQTSELFKATNATIAMNMSLILDELLAKTQLADELQSQINALKGAKEKGLKPTKITAITELEALMAKMGKKNVSLSQVEEQLLEANSQIQALKKSQATLQSHVDDQNVRIQVLLADLQTKEDLLLSKNNKLKQQHLNNQAATDELDKLRIETKEARQKLAELQKSLANNDLEREAIAKQAQSSTAPLRERITSLELQLAEALKTNEILANDKDTLNQELVPVKSSLKEALAQVAQLTNDIETAKNALQQEEDTRLSLTSEAERTKRALKEAQEKYTELSNKFVELETELTSETSLQSEQVTALKQQLEDTLKNNAALTDEKKTLIEKLTDLQSINDSLNKELAPANASLQEALAQVALLTKDIESAKTALQQEEDTRLSLTSEAEGTRLALEQAQEKYTALANKFAELETELTSETSLQSGQVTALKQQLADTLKSNAVLTDEKKAFIDKLTELQSINDSLNKELAPANASLKEALAQVALLTKEIQKVKTVQQQTEETRLSISTEREATKLALDQAREKYSALHSQYTELEAALQNTNTKRTEQITSLQSLLQEQTASTEAIQGDFEAKLATTAASLKAANEESATLRSTIEQLATTIAEQDQTIQDLTNKTSTENSEQVLKTTQLREEVAAAKLLSDKQAAALQSTEENLTTLQEKQKSLTASLSDTQQQLMSSQEETAALQATIASLTEERNQLLRVSKDSDNDGINDAEDTCPDTVQGASVNAQGCEEDTDNDGLVDRLDLCPDTAPGATIDSVGCGVDQKTVILKGISFQFGTADLTEEAHSVLNSAAVILQNNPEIRMEVAGHTDSRGDNNANIHLSTLRAEAVLSYLVSAGIAADRLQAKGYGSDKPIADNTTREGRAKNRRVELKRIDTAPAAPQNSEPVPTTNETTE